MAVLAIAVNALFHYSKDPTMSNPPTCPQCTLESIYPDGAGDHEVDCKTDQGALMLKAEFMKKS